MNNTAFRVVKGTDEKISIMPNVNGSVYFATDSKKIYLDNEGKRLSMGGNTGVYYATADFEGVEGPEFFFAFEDIEGDNIPNPDDLIINSDGSFYRVLEKVDDEIKASRLTIAGGDGTTENIYGKISMQIEGSTNRTVLLDQELNIDVIFSACDIDGENTGKGRYEVYVDKVIRKKGEIENSHGIQEPKAAPIEIGSIFAQPGEYTVKIVCYGYTGGLNEVSVSKILNIKVTDFTLAWDYDITTINAIDNDFEINWRINVESDNVTTRILIDDQHLIEKQNTTSLKINADDLSSYGLTHGAHKFQITAWAAIGSDIEEKPSNTITKNVIFYNNKKGEYIVACNFFENTVSQYTTIQIPVMIYHNDNVNGTAEINFTVNGTPKQPLQNCKNLTTYYFAYTPDTAGFIPLQFSCGGGRANLILNVESLNLNISEVPGYEFKFKASDFSNNEEIQTWKIQNQHLEFSTNFDWINGGLKSGIDDVGPYFKVTAGTTVTFPYKLFATDLKNTGACFKMIFKAHNCRDYDAIVANASSPNDGRGVILRAQNASIKSLSKELIVRYCEDTYIEYEFDVCQYNEGDVTSQYLTTWLDGIPASVTDLSDNDSFMQLSPVSDLIIGSDDCDVYIYLIKFYKKHLTSTEHLNNFIMDAPNSTEMVNRFNRNDVLMTDRNGNKYIHPETLASKNPDCNVFIYEVPSVPTSKKDVVDDKGNDKCCKFTHLKGSSEALRHYEGVKLRAQGTSSMNLGTAAFNLDTTLPEAISITDEAIPVKYLNTKVNVASCEGANNALNQEWYNRYQPYRCKKRRQIRTDGKLARDTMQFINGVVFIQDNNKIINDAAPTKNNVFKEIPGYVQSPYPRMYAIGNMGNAKKNAEVFHGAGNQYECCIDNTNNNTGTQRMLFVGGCIFPPPGSSDDEIARDIALNLPDSLFDKDGFVVSGVDWGETYDEVTGTYMSNKDLWKNTLIKEGFFEFRYCKDEENFIPSEEFPTYDDYQWELSNRFLRLVRWFAINNPYNATNEDLPTPVTFEDYTVKGVKATAYHDYDEKEILKGTVIAGGTFTKDSAEYRVAKMLRESENYLILDSIVYHYLFIERHTLVDNVAKNTFWNTEDGIHWDLTKDYDNDTADGVNNDGELVFDYGIEIKDKTATGTAVFNAYPSAWLHFIDGLLPLREKMYQSLQNVWRSDIYIEAFDTWQKAIPEICWIEHFDRLYFRPRNVYGNKDYLKRLAGGKKTHQRRQYETYQEQYMNSEYKTNTEEGSSISWRSHQPTDRPDIANADGDYTISAKVKLYADGYFSAAFATKVGEASAINMHVRGKKGDIIPFSKTSKSPFDDATCYIYSPNLYQEFTETEGLYPASITASAAQKLRKITYIPQNDVQKKMIKSTLTLGANVEEIVLKECKSPTGEKVDLNLSNNTRLKILDTTGSDVFTGYSIADGAPITTLNIEKPTALTLQNLRYLTPDKFTINDYSRLGKIEINNIDYNGINSKDIVKNTIMNREIGIEYDLQNVNWVFDADDNITSTNIPLLDKLKDSVPVAGKTQALAVTGMATVPNEAYKEADPLSLYKKYGLTSNDDSTYPNLILNFLDEDENQKLYTIDIVDGDGKIVWSRQVSTFNDLTNNILNNSALGAFNADNAIRKSSSNESIYTFNSTWTYTTASGNTGIISGSAEEYQGLNLAELAGLNEENIVIKPNYLSEIRHYTINFYNQGQLFETREATYGTPFADIKPSIIPVKDDSNLALTKTYQLIGYGAIEGENTTISESTWAVTVDTNLYAVFMETDVYKVDYTECLDINGTVVEGLKINNTGQFVYQGKKIVIPANITEIASDAFKSHDKAGKNGQINYVFVAQGSMLQNIGARAFQGQEIKYFDFTNATKLLVIDQDAFQYSCILSSSLYKQATITLPSSLTRIGSHAFNQCQGEGVIFTLIVPSSVTYMGPYAISNWSTVQDAIIQIGKPNDLSKLSFEANYNGEPVITSNYATSSGADIKAVYFYTNRYTSEQLIDKYIKNVDLSCMTE